MKPDESKEEKPENNTRTESEVEHLLGVPIVIEDGDGLTDDERRRINEALKSGEAQKLLDATAKVHLEAIDTDAKQLMTPHLEARQKRNELMQRREAKEISQYDFDLNFIFRLHEIGSPLTRKNLVHETGNQAVVLNREELEILGCLDFIHVSGERMLIEPESLREGDVLILYPEELGDEEGKPYLQATE